MKTSTITFVGASAIVVVLAVGFAIVRPVLAQVVATSTDSETASTSPVDTFSSPPPADASSTPSTESAPSSTIPVQLSPTNGADTTANNPGSTAGTAAPQKTRTEPPPAGLTEVHIVGTKYIDYFTDGSSTIAVTGDPTIDGNLDKPDAPIPTHAGMTWVHTTGQNLYDTQSGDLEEGDYALDRDGSYIQHGRAFVSSTSTLAQAGTSQTSSPLTSGASSTTPTTSSSTSPAVLSAPPSVLHRATLRRLPLQQARTHPQLPHRPPHWAPARMLRLLRACKTYTPRPPGDVRILPNSGRIAAMQHTSESGQVGTHAAQQAPAAWMSRFSWRTYRDKLT